MPYVNPYPYQKEGVLSIEALGDRALLGDEMGLGKTIQALYWLKRSKNRNLLPAIVVCPWNLKWSWEHTATHMVGLPATVLETRQPPKRGLVKPGGVFIINYDILAAWTEWLLELNPQALVIDECQKIQNPEAKRTIACKALARHTPGVLPMSGTAITNRPAEIFTSLNMIDAARWPSFLEFGVEYCEPRLQYGRWVYKGAKNLGKLHQELKSVMIRRYKKDVLKDLPDKTRSVVPVPIRDPGEYTAASNDFLGWLKQTSPGAAHRAKRSEGLTKVGYLKRLAAKLKMKAALDWVDDMLESAEPGKKVVLFGYHEACIRAAAKRHAGHCVVVDGSTSRASRKVAVELFQNDPKTTVFIGNIESAGVGLTLTASDTAVFLEMDWRPGLMVQAEDRIHRIGQLKNAMIYYLVAHGTIEETVCRLLQEKQEVLNAVLDGTVETVDELDIYDRLIDQMRTLAA